MARTPTSTAASNSLLRWRRRYRGSPADLYPEVAGWDEFKPWLLVTLGAAALVIVVSLYAVHRYVTHSNAAKRSLAARELAGLKIALDRYYRDYGFYPTTDQGLETVTGFSREIDSGMLRGYRPPKKSGALRRDPWGNPFFYQSDGNSFVLKSLGADGVEGGTGDDADVELPSQ